MKSIFHANFQNFFTILDFPKIFLTHRLRNTALEHDIVIIIIINFLLFILNLLFLQNIGLNHPTVISLFSRFTSLKIFWCNVPAPLNLFFVTLICTRVPYLSSRFTQKRRKINSKKMKRKRLKTLSCFSMLLRFEKKLSQ